MFQALRDITSPYGSSESEIIRVLSVIMFVFFLGLSVYDTVKNEELNYIQFIGGGVTIIGTVAGSLRAKEGLPNPATIPEDNTK